MDYLDMLLKSPPPNESSATTDVMSSEHQFPAFSSRNDKVQTKRKRLAERIVNTDELVRQVKQLKETNKKLSDFQRTAEKVSDLYQQEKQQRQELECRQKQLTERCNLLDEDLDAHKSQKEYLKDKLKEMELPATAKDVAITYIQLAHRMMDKELGGGGLLRRETIMLRKLKDYCKKENIEIPTTQSPDNRRKAVKTSTSIKQGEHLQNPTTTDTQKPTTLKLEDKFNMSPTPQPKPMTCEFAVQCGGSVVMKDQATQHRNTTATRGTTTATFFTKHNVGTCFPELTPPPTAEEILKEILSWDVTPISPINDIFPKELEPPLVSKINVGTCTTLCNVHREIDFLSAIPSQIKHSNSRPPSRGVKDEIAMPSGSFDYINIAREFLNSLPQNQLPTSPPSAFEEMCLCFFGQLLFRILQKRSDPTPVTSQPMSQADFLNWLNHGVIFNEATGSFTPKNNKGYEANAESRKDVGTDPIVDESISIGVDLTPIYLPPKPKSKIRKRKTKPDSNSSSETAINFVSSLNAFHQPSCDNLEADLKPEERYLLDLTSKIAEQTLVNNSDTKEQCTQNILQFSEEQKLTHKKRKMKLTLFGNDSDSQDSGDEEMMTDLEKTQTVQMANIGNSPELPFCKNSSDTGELNCCPFDTLDAQTVKGGHNSKISFGCDSLVETETTSNPLTSLQLTSEQTGHWNCSDTSVLGDFDFENNESIDRNKGRAAYGRYADSEDSDSEDLRESEIKGSLEDKGTNISLKNSPECNFNSDSFESIELVIDTERGDHIECGGRNESKIIPYPPNRKRKRTSSSQSDYPTDKRMTRLRAKKLQLESPGKEDNHEEKTMTNKLEISSSADCDNTLLESMPSIASHTFSDLESPASPAAVDCATENVCQPKNIPLIPRDPVGNKPKALLFYLIKTAESGPKTRGPRNTLQQPEMKRLLLNIATYFKESLEIESSCSDFADVLKKITTDTTTIINAIISTFAQLKHDENVTVCRLLTVVKYLETKQANFIGRFLHVLEQRMFSVKEKNSSAEAHKFLKLYLKLLSLQANLGSSTTYVNPARLLIAKILYYYTTDMPSLVLEVVNQYPTVLPHREERSYDHSDPLITVIKHLLMCYKYNVEDEKKADRALLSKLRYEYHFQPFEPTKNQVLENLIEKLKAGKVQDLCYAFALFCRRSFKLLVIQDVLTEQLMPLALTYCDLCTHTEEYVERCETLIQCISLIVKQLESQTDISAYLLFFKLQLKNPRPCIQQAAVQAIIRLQRFGFKNVIEALHNYRPNYELTPMTRAMLRTFVENRRQYQSQRPFRQPKNT
ncbi:little elongation complex subunit 1 [Scaptodrosophila lebanonensis]|uniref:Little elongation complex subunit 1 n=1 Tax=Drosophila lebanonensis TaxID=7225 RepID=A0A6J2T1Q5_DROLE|nr:little elongation complex subunit 1 [Scaptodrosophila lebanonensis]